MHQNPNIPQLLAKLIRGTLTTEESLLLEAWRQESEANNRLYNRMIDPAYLEAQLEGWDDQDQERIRQQLFLPKRRKHWPYATAAAILACAAVYLLRYDGATAPSLQTADTSFTPRGNVARLLIDDGKELSLKGNSQEFEASDGTEVKDNGEGTLQYNAKEKAAPVYHTLITPKGGEYSVTLSDGTRAWLNAASSLRFPTHFEGKERVVELSGEAYFEVSADAEHPFIVKTKHSDVRVLGTAFNVSAYADEQEERTTLSTGTVQVANIVLKPGFQTIVRGANIKMIQADMEETLAWKNGLFIFKASSLGDILHQLGRWYDVDVQCESSLQKQLHFTGRIQRSGHIRGVLELLEMTGKVKFSMDGRKLTVSGS